MRVYCLVSLILLDSFDPNSQRYETDYGTSEIMDMQKNKLDVHGTVYR